MSNEQITQETVPVETATPSTETVQPTATLNTVAKSDTPITPSSWKESISEEFRSDPSIENLRRLMH